MTSTASIKEVNHFTRKKILRNFNFLDLRPIRKFDHELDKQANVVVLISQLYIRKLVTFKEILK